MKIANPLYDHAFKYLMSNDRLAKKVLSLILDQEVVDLELSQQEIIVVDPDRQFTLCRLDFKAQIKDPNGKIETVMIELQKSKLPSNVQRFRSYLGATYAQRKEIEENGIKIQVSYPIISIYILGYNLVDVPVMAVKIDPKMTDMSSRQVMDIKSDFIDLITHKTYILQVRRLPPKRVTRIEQFMTLFNQAWIKEKNYILDIEDIPEEFRDIAEYLKKSLVDEELRMMLEAEQEFEDLFATIEAQKKQLEYDLDKEKSDKEEERRMKEEERRMKEEAQEKLRVLAKHLLATGMTPAQVAEMTGLTLDDFEHED